MSMHGHSDPVAAVTCIWRVQQVSLVAAAALHQVRICITIRSAFPTARALQCVREVKKVATPFLMRHTSLPYNVMTAK
jgi:hypothetical protein